MGRKGANTTIMQRELVIKHYCQQKTYEEIAEMLNMKKSTVGDIVRRYKNEGRITSIKQKGQPKKLTSRDEHSIIRKIKRNPRLSAPKIACEVFSEYGKIVSAQTIRRTIKTDGYNGRVARKKPLINERNQKIRFNFAKEYINKDQTWWNDVIYLDESKYNLFGSDGRCMVWRKPNTQLEAKNIVPTVKHGGGSVMVWGCISAQGVGNIVFIDTTMTKEIYLNILKANLQQSAAKMGIESSFKLYQDNDPKHKAYIVRNWLLYNCPKVIESPPQSPDLNPIENLWDELDRRIRTRPISSLKQLKERLQEEWAKIDTNYFKKIISNMPKRLNDVIAAKGLHTKY